MELVAGLQPKCTHLGSIYINALCAISAADGNFCIAEQREIEKRVAKAPIELSAASVKNVIAGWCDRARQGSVIGMIAQSIVDTQNMRSNLPLAKSMVLDLRAIAQADGDPSKSESVVHNAIVNQLKGKGNS